MGDKKLVITIEIDLGELADTINNAVNLNDNERLFAALSSVTSPKRQLEDALEEVKKLESVSKGLISSRADDLYGKDWTAIKGEGYKITRIKTGPVYSIVGKARSQFLEVKTTVNTKVVDEYVKLKNTLPTGIEINSSRGESLRMTVKE
jgi:hypothetical protein